jgi:glutamate-1-semialdehyde 2,1-aminomutase
MARLQKKDALYERALAVIPGGMYGHEDIRYLTEDFPLYFSRAKGGRLQELSATRLLD